MSKQWRVIDKQWAGAPMTYLEACEEYRSRRLRPDTDPYLQCEGEGGYGWRTITAPVRRYDIDDIELPARHRTTFACIHLIAPRDSVPMGAPWSPYPEGERVGMVTWDPCETTFDEAIQDTEWAGEWHEYAPGCWAGDGFLALM